MEDKIDRNRRLADYIYDDLGPEEIMEIERKISDDPQLSESYRLNMQVKEYLQAKVQLEDMRADPQLEDAEKLADMAFNFESDKREDHVSITLGPKRRRINTMAFIAASAAVVTIIVTVGKIPSGINQDRLFDRYYKPIEASDFTRRGDNETYRVIAEGINHYSEENYNQSISLFSELSTDPAIRSEVDLFTGLSYLGLGHYQTAQNILEKIPDSNTTRYLPEILWYLSLCYLKTGDFQKAQATLVKLEAYNGMYNKDTQTLLKNLRRFK